jgi:hypothetical protein
MLKHGTLTNMEVPQWLSYISIEWLVLIGLIVAIVCWVRLYSEATNDSAAHGALALILGMCCFATIQVMYIFAENELIETSTFPVLWLYRATVFLFAIGSWLRYAGR